MYIEYKAYGQNICSTTVGDWGQSLLYANKLGEKANKLVDLCHHLPNVNIEQDCSFTRRNANLADFILMIQNMEMMDLQWVVLIHISSS